MKKDIHPQYFSKAKITCACGNVIETGSTTKSMEVEICSACHPFFTGKKKMVDSTGRVDRFKKMTEKAAAKKKSKKTISKTEKRAKKAAKKKDKK